MAPCSSASIANAEHVITGWVVIGGVQLKSQIIERKPLISIN